AVERHRLDGLPDEVEKGLRALRRAEPDRAPRREGRRTGGQVEDDVVRVDREQVGAGRCLLAGEVLAGCRRGHEEAPARSGSGTPGYAGTRRAAVHALTARKAPKSG